MLYAKFLDPTNYFVLKQLFGTEKNKDILIHFLNAILVFKPKLPIVEVEFLHKVENPDISYRKTSIVDVLCKDDMGNNYIVQIHTSRILDFEKNAQIYASKAYCSQTDKYPELKEVVFIAISNFIMFPDKKRYKSDHVILDTENPDLKNFSFTFLELPKFMKKSDDLSTIVERWCYFFKHAQETSCEELDKIIGKDVIIEKAYRALDRFSWNAEELLTYEESEKRMNDYLSSIGQKFIEGMAEGKAESLAENIENGWKQGFAEGVRNSQIATTKNMLLKKIPLKKVVNVTGLSLKEVKEIQASTKKTSSKSVRSVKT